MPAVGDALLGHLEERKLSYEDTFARVAREAGVGYEALRRANPGIDAWIPGAGKVVVLPKTMLLPRASRKGVLVNLSELRLYFFDPANDQVFVYPIGIGSEGTETPVMQTQIIAKIQQPIWYPPDSVRARHAAAGDPLPRKVLPGPDNPLGEYAIQLARRGYFIHGTNQPIGVGRRVSSGCIRLYGRHIEALVKQVANGAEVKVIRQPYKVAWHQGILYMEAHPFRREKSRSHSGFVGEIIRATANRTAEIDWNLALEVAQAGQGLPVRISR